ncbi:hypothetical protein GCM10023082_31010 [Streptomyces tremellae]|uniref:Uncharacterized protein n=1 Tax=Streptomyces tremellae TaxID=1124239 RepID=A0ABP7F4Y6_9ACTN
MLLAHVNTLAGIPDALTERACVDVCHVRDSRTPPPGRRLAPGTDRSPHPRRHPFRYAPAALVDHVRTIGLTMCPMPAFVTVDHITFTVRTRILDRK